MISCPDSDEIESNLPIARAGKNDTIQVGMYAILDGSASYFGDDPEFQSFIWSSDELNSHEFFIMNELQSNVGFTTEGVFNFILTVNDRDGITDSDTVTFTVLPRLKIYFDDPSLDVAVRYSIKSPQIEFNNELLLSINTLVYAPIIFDDIYSLSGLEFCANITELILGYQNISSINEIAHLTKLKTLCLNYNQISDISVLSNCEDLEYLKLMENNISDISPLETLYKLQYLDLANNPILDIYPIRNHVNLRELYFHYGLFTDIEPVSNLTELIVLWISDTPISDISCLEKLSNLDYVHLRGNDITDVSVFNVLNQFSRLIISRNSIVDISPLENLPNIEYLNLGYNKIHNIFPLVENSGLDKGDVVILTGNPLNDVSISSFIPTLEERGVIINF